MVFNLKLRVVNTPVAFLPKNYHYLFSAVFYKMLSRSNAEFATNMHDNGFGKKRTKFFTFSDIRTGFLFHGDRLMITDEKAEMTICVFMNEVSENFITGLLMHQEFKIYDRSSSVTFIIEDIESFTYNFTYDLTSCLVEPISPVVSGRKNDGSKYLQYLSPEEDGFCDHIIARLLQKYKTIYNLDDKVIDTIGCNVNAEVIFYYGAKPKMRLSVISEGTPSETTVRGYKNFQIKFTAPGKFIELALYSGIGLYNSQGMGCLRLIKKTIV